VGNEINGEWLFGNTKRCSPKTSVKSTSQADVVAKMTETFDYLKSQGKVTALTLYYNTPCRRPAANEMFTWADANVPARMKTGLDYLLVSYYEVDCHGHKARLAAGLQSARNHGFLTQARHFRVWLVGQESFRSGH